MSSLIQTRLFAKRHFYGTKWFQTRHDFSNELIWCTFHTKLLRLISELPIPAALNPWTSILLVPVFNISRVTSLEDLVSTSWPTRYSFAPPCSAGDDATHVPPPSVLILNMHFHHQQRYETFKVPLGSLLDCPCPIISVAKMFNNLGSLLGSCGQI